MCYTSHFELSKTKRLFLILISYIFIYIFKLYLYLVWWSSCQRRGVNIYRWKTSGGQFVAVGKNRLIQDFSDITKCFFKHYQTLRSDMYFLQSLLAPVAFQCLNVLFNVLQTHMFWQ